MKDCGGHFHGKHLKSSLEYIMNSEKTQDGRLIGGMNCQSDTAFEQMKETKRKFNKIDKRQGYHLILSFKEGETNPDTAFAITSEFVKEYLGKEYEAVYVVHDNTEHVHSHIVFNSVSFLDGKKFRYEKGDWAKKIQPITNKLCQQYGLSVLDVEEELKDAKVKNSEHYKEWNENRDGQFVWSDMIKRDIDACILQTDTFEGFVDLLSDKGYEFKCGKHLAVRPPGMKRFRRCDTLGNDYSEDSIYRRIAIEDLDYYRISKQEVEPQIVKCYVKRYKRAKMSGLQKRYCAKLYRIGQLKKRPYSQAWKYKEDIRKMQKLQQEYLFLVNHDVYTAQDLALVVDSLTDEKKSIGREKSKVYRARQKCKSLFDIAEKMKELIPAEISFQNGDDFFCEEHEKWKDLEQQLKEQGYSYHEVQDLKEYYRMQISDKRKLESIVTKELRTGERIMEDILKSDDVTLSKEINRDTDKERTRTDGKMQPVR